MAYYKKPPKQQSSLYEDNKKQHTLLEELNPKIIKKPWALQDILNTFCLCILIVLGIITIVFAVLTYGHITIFEQAMSSVLKVFAGEMIKIKYKVTDNNLIVSGIQLNLTSLFFPGTDGESTSILIPPQPQIDYDDSTSSFGYNVSKSLSYLLYSTPSHLNLTERIKIISIKCNSILFGVQPKSCNNFIKNRDSSNYYYEVYCYNIKIEEMECCSNIIYQCQQTVQNDFGVCGWDFVWYPNSCIACDFGVQYNAFKLNTCSTLNVNNDTDTFLHIDNSIFYSTTNISDNSYLLQPPNTNIDLLNQLPNPRDITNNFFSNSGYYNDSTTKPSISVLNLLGSAWIEFFISDFYNPSISIPRDNILITGDYLIPMPMPVSINNTYYRIDPLFIQTFYFKTVDRGRRYDDDDDTTIWADASQIYGNSIIETNKIRLFINGKINSDFDTIIINNNNKKIYSWVGPIILKYIWILEHNHIADIIKNSNNSLTDEEIFQTTRLIVSMEIIKTTLLEWIPLFSNNTISTNETEYIWNSIIGGNYSDLFNNNNNMTMKIPLEFKSLTKPFLFLNSPLFNDTFNLCTLSQFTLTNDTETNTMELIQNFLNKIININTNKFSFKNFNNQWMNFDSSICYPFIFNNNTTTTTPFPYHQPLYNTKNNILFDKRDIILESIMSDRLDQTMKFNELRKYVNLPSINTFMDLYNINNINALKMAMLYKWNVSNIDLLVGLLGEVDGDTDTDTNSSQSLSNIHSVIYMMNEFLQNILQNDKSYTTNFVNEYYSSIGITRIRNRTITFSYIISEIFNTTNQENIFMYSS